MNKENEIIKEYSYITNNAAYYNSFNKRVLKAINNTIIGNSQRNDFLPYLENILTSEKELNIFDIGAGSGEIINYIQKYLKNKNITFNLEEPNDILLEIYKNKLINMNIKINKIYKEYIQDLYTKNDIPKNINLILSIHMVYHLTNFMEKSINPEKDIINFVDFLFNCIKNNGTIFIVYTDLENSYSGDVTLDYYKNKYDENTKHCFSNIKKIYRARNYMFKENNIEKILRNKYNNFNIKIYETESYFYGNNLEDLAAMGLVGELLPSNNDIFDINKLKYILNLLYNNKININIEDRNILQKNMFKVNQNQVVYIIKKEQEQYNNISEEYKISKKLPFREYIEKNSLFELIGNINGFNVLDLACGEGHYSRILEKIGAKEVIGIDISENMINIAKKENQINNIKNVKYYNCNVTEMELLDIEVEYFDIVIAAYLLNYASSKEELFNFTKNIFKYLKPGCKFVTINDNPSIYCFDNCSLKYNYIKKLKNNNIPKNGDSIDWILFNSDSINDKLCEFTTYHWDKDIYIEAFKHAGFNEIEFIPCTISEKGIKKYNDTYWNNFLNHPHFICIKAIKPF